MRRYTAEHHISVSKGDFDRLSDVAAQVEATASEVFRRALQQGIAAQRSVLRSLVIDRPAGCLVNVHIKLSHPTDCGIKTVAADLGVSFAGLARGILRAYLDQRI